MNGFSPRDIWNQVRRARLIRVFAVYLSVSFVVLQFVDILVVQLGLPDWFFPGALVLLLLGLPIISATAVVQSQAAGAEGAGREAAPTSTAGAEPGSGAAAAGAAGRETALRPEAPEAGAGAPAAPGAGASEPVVEPATTPGPAGPRPAEPAAMRSQATRGGAAAPATASPAPAAVFLPALRGWLTWRRAILGGVAAFALWGLVVSGYMAMRTLGIGPVGSLVAAGVLEAEERILVAEFQNRTEDDVLGTAAAEAFRVDLSQSPILTVVPSALVADALARMDRAPDTPSSSTRPAPRGPPSHAWGPIRTFESAIHYPCPSPRPDYLATNREMAFVFLILLSSPLLNWTWSWRRARESTASK